MKTTLILLLATTSMLACNRQTTDKNVVQIETLGFNVEIKLSDYAYSKF